MDDAETRLIANALCEIRSLLAPYIGSESEAPTDVRLAAHLAYALHNEASALAAGTGFDLSAALKKVVAIDGILGTADGRRLVNLWSIEPKGEA